MRTPHGLFSCVLAAMLLAASTVTTLALPTDSSSLDQTPDARPPTTLPRNNNIATRDDDAVPGNVTTLRTRNNNNDGSFWMAPLASADDDISGYISQRDPNLVHVIPRWGYGPGTAPDPSDPEKVYCQDFAEIKDETSDKSPLISDCQAIIDNISPPDHPGDWKFMIGQTRELVSKGSCVVAVSSSSGLRGSWMHVGNMDVIAVLEELKALRDGVKKDKDKMGGKTSARCKITIINKPGPAEFSVYHT